MTIDNDRIRKPVIDRLIQRLGLVGFEVRQQHRGNLINGLFCSVTNGDEYRNGADILKLGNEAVSRGYAVAYSVHFSNRMEILIGTHDWVNNFAEWDADIIYNYLDTKRNEALKERDRISKVKAEKSEKQRVWRAACRARAVELNPEIENHITVLEQDDETRTGAGLAIIHGDLIKNQYILFSYAPENGFIRSENNGDMRMEISSRGLVAESSTYETSSTTVYGAYSLVDGLLYYCSLWNVNITLEE